MDEAKDNTEAELWVSQKEFIRLTGRSKSTIVRLKNLGYLTIDPPVKVKGICPRYAVSDIAKWRR